jgi:OOP family OmpA-OmpF porin
MSDYTKEGLDGALTALKYAGGKTPMAEAIDAAADDLKGAQGPIAVILISDGDRELMDRSAAVAAESMKKRYGDGLCIYTVFIGDEDPESKDPVGWLYRKIVGDVLSGKALMDKIVENGQCGVAVDAKDKMSSQGMADFVETVFLKKYTDSDGDGVWDHLDQCPDTPKGVKVDEKGCPVLKFEPVVVPMDSDGDGVYNDVDQCPRTPKGAQVDERGCWVIRTINFDFNKYNIKEEFQPRLNKVVDVLKNNPGLIIEIEGNTDNIGSVKYNQTLSEKRALAVKKYLVAKGISADRLRAVGYGMSKPIATNETEAGRAKNRRVEMTPTGL